MNQPRLKTQSQDVSPATPSDADNVELPILSPDELKDVYCKVCAGTFDLSSTGVFPEHFFNFRSVRKPCGASGMRYAHVSGGPKRASNPTNVNNQSDKQPVGENKLERRSITLLADGSAECPICERRMSPNKKKNTLPLHKNDGEVCPASNDTFEFIPSDLPSKAGRKRVKKTKAGAKPQYDVQKYLDKYRLRSPEELRKEREKEEQKKRKSKKRSKVTASQRAARDRRREERREQRRQQRRSDSYALDCYDSWGQDDHRVDQGVSVRTYRGGLPGQGKRR